MEEASQLNARTPDPRRAPTGVYIALSTVDRMALAAMSITKGAMDMRRIPRYLVPFDLRSGKEVPAPRFDLPVPGPAVDAYMFAAVQDESDGRP